MFRSQCLSYHELFVRVHVVDNGVNRDIDVECFTDEIAVSDILEDFWDDLAAHRAAVAEGPASQKYAVFGVWIEGTDIAACDVLTKQCELRHMNATQLMDSYDDITLGLGNTLENETFALDASTKMMTSTQTIATPAAYGPPGFAPLYWEKIA